MCQNLSEVIGSYLLLLFSTVGSSGSFSYKVYIYQFVIRNMCWILFSRNSKCPRRVCKRVEECIEMNSIHHLHFMQFNFALFFLYFPFSLAIMHFFSSSLIFFLLNTHLSIISIMLSWDNLLLKSVGCDSDTKKNNDFVLKDAWNTS